MQSLNPRNAGALPLHMNRYIKVPIPFIKRTKAGSITVLPAAWLNKNGTKTEAPNIANRC